jgi:hypothetical protein
VSLGCATENLAQAALAHGLHADAQLVRAEAGNTLQFNDPAFMAELKTWIRFGHDEAIRSGDSLFAGASGNPVVPRWLGSRLMGLVVTAESENKHLAKQLRSSAGMAVFVSQANDQAHWVKAASIRPQLAAWLGLGHLRPDLVVRFGHGPTLPWSMRRPLQAVLR